MFVCVSAAAFLIIIRTGALESKSKAKEEREDEHDWEDEVEGKREKRALE